MNELKKIESDIQLEKLKTELKKEKFIKDIKNGLGDHIKVNGGSVKKIKKSFIKRIWEKVLKIF
jgi:hypothetical protein